MISDKKKYLIIFCIACFIFLAIFLFFIQPRKIQFSQGLLKFTNQKITIKIDIAASESQLETGLMHRDRLDNNQGMLLVFKKQKHPQIWMKNMLIPLDIIFISTQNQVVFLLKNIPPCLINPCSVYEANTPVKMVLELNTGKIDQYNIKIGDKVSVLVQ